MIKRKTNTKSLKKRAKVYKLALSKRAEKGLKKIPLRQRERILLTLHQLRFNPFIGKKLEGKYKNEYSIRVWPYRIIYTIKKQKLIIEVIEIGHRGGAYGR